MYSATSLSAAEAASRTTAAAAAAVMSNGAAPISHGLAAASSGAAAGSSSSSAGDPLSVYTPLHSFSVLLQQTQQRTCALYISNVGLRPAAFLPASEEKLKIKLHDEYYFPPVAAVAAAPGAATSHAAAAAVAKLPPFASPAAVEAEISSTASNSSTPSTLPGVRTPEKNTLSVLSDGDASRETPHHNNNNNSQSSSSTISTLSTTDKSSAAAETETCAAAVTPSVVHRPDMSYIDLVSELSARTAAASIATLPPGFAASTGLQQNSASQISLLSTTNTSVSAALSTTATAAERTAAGDTQLLANFTGGGELASLRLRHLPPALRPAWHPPWKLHRVIAGHLGWVTCIAVDPTNEWFASGSNDRLIKIWDLATGALKLSLTGHVSALRDIKISSRHPYMFTCGEDNRVKCWDLEQNKVVRDYHGHLSGVYTLALHPQLDVLCSGGRDAVVRVWDMRAKKEIYVLEGHTGTVMALQMQSLEPHIISGSQDKMVRLWDLNTGKCSAVLTNHKKSIRAMAFHPTEYSFVSCAADKVKVWRCPLGQFERNIEGHNAILNCCAVKEDGDSSVLIAGSNNGQLHFWDWSTGHKFDTIQSRVQPGSLESENGIFCCALDKSETRLLTGECDKTIKNIFAGDGQCMHTLYTSVETEKERRYRESCPLVLHASDRYNYNTQIQHASVSNSPLHDADEFDKHPRDPCTLRSAFSASP